VTRPRSSRSLTASAALAISRNSQVANSERALAIDETAYGPSHPTVAIRLGNLALTLQDLGETEQAQRLLERAAAIRGKRHPYRPEPDQETEA
jgi:hypothetical protein